MFKLFAFGAGFGAAFQAWRNYPADGPVSADMLAVVFAAALVAAYLGGKWHGRGMSASATAVAVASADATAVAANTNTVNLFVATPGSGARPVGVALPSDHAPWLTGEERPQLELDQLDGMDLEELAYERSTEVDAEGRPW